MGCSDPYDYLYDTRTPPKPSKEYRLDELEKRMDKLQRTLDRLVKRLDAR